MQSMPIMDIGKKPCELCKEFVSDDAGSRFCNDCKEAYTLGRLEAQERMKARIESWIIPDLFPLDSDE